MLLFQIIQVSSQGWLYLRPVNLLDWYTYISAILITLNEEGENECSIKKVNKRRNMFSLLGWEYVGSTPVQLIESFAVVDLSCVLTVNPKERGGRERECVCACAS